MQSKVMEKPSRTSSLESDITRASDNFYSALHAMFKGDLEPMSQVWSHADDVSLLAPFGGRQVGWDSVRKELEGELNLNITGQVERSDLSIHVSGNDEGSLAWTVCDEACHDMTIGGKTVQMSLRATSVYRFESGAWKMVHHHADMAPQSSVQAVDEGSTGSPSSESIAGRESSLGGEAYDF